VGRICFTLEDPVREVPGEDVPLWKIRTDTAIPVGRYRIAITYSPKFKQRMPILLRVPGFEGIRIHWGNTSADTDGCILVGQSRLGTVLLHSRAAFEPLYKRLETALLATEEVWIGVS
jgi:hypothetical protein